MRRINTRWDSSSAPCAARKTTSTTYGLPELSEKLVVVLDPPLVDVTESDDLVPRVGHPVDDAPQEELSSGAASDLKCCKTNTYISELGLASAMSICEIPTMAVRPPNFFVDAVVILLIGVILLDLK